MKGIAFWTCCFRSAQGRAEVVKVLKNTIKVKLLEDVVLTGGPFAGENTTRPDYTAGWILQLPQVATKQNGFIPDAGEVDSHTLISSGLEDRNNSLSARADELRGRAAALREKAAALIKQNAPYDGDHAFNTQPGHIPERARCIARTEKAWALIKEAEDLECSARNIENK